MKAMSAICILILITIWKISQPLQDPQTPNVAVATLVLQKKALNSLALKDEDMDFSMPTYLVENNSVVMIGRGQSKYVAQHENDPLSDMRVSVTFDGRLSVRCSDWRPNCYDVEDMSVTALSSVAPRI